ncbi:hypothetical protein ASE21_04895 [Flavobacterium sp. Root901]|uniref:hypothetical protein n=1 Tax=Flavobacterium sp. Root901 TaxID=1736605 RepID=UPI000709FEF8|nr:hypothetical protein [Flavobacterium sp. Root901]KRD11059.1 hypothetical protein ASE21_04895 [Flavobacterium sp. Root901]
MATNNLSKETEKKLLNFFNEVIDPKDLVKAIRQLNYIIAISIVAEDEFGTTYSQSENLEKGFNWLNELAEILLPYLEVK